MGTPRHDNWQRARQAAQAILYGPAEIRLARAVLHRLRTDIAAGLPHRALIERIDDELYQLAHPPK